MYFAATEKGGNMEKVNGKSYFTDDAPEVVRFKTVVEQVEKSTVEHCQKIAEGAMTAAADRVVAKRRKNGAKLKQLVDFLREVDSDEDEPEITIEEPSEPEAKAV